MSEVGEVLGNRRTHQGEVRSGENRRVHVLPTGAVVTQHHTIVAMEGCGPGLSHLLIFKEILEICIFR